MFTGLVQFLSEVAEVVEERPGKRLVLREPRLAASANVGDSVALNGCCLTIVAVDRERVSFQAGEETLSRTNLGELVRGHRVNVELPLKAGEPIGGHIVTGHIDAVGTIASRSDNGDWSTMWFHAPPTLLVQMASKGSVAIDGVSLTLVEVDKDRFSVALIPHTLAVTTLGQRKVGDRVNLETDILAKYVERQIVASREHGATSKD
jgi:riboflavin synthase